MLPILESPTYEVRLPSSGKIISYRPFLVKEEKILLMAQESDDPRQMLIAMKETIKACTFGKIVPNDLTSYDLEFLFLKLRTKSVGETSAVKLKCDACDAYTPVNVNIDEIEIPVVSSEPINIMLSGDVGVTMRHIRVRDLANLSNESRSQSDRVSDTIIASIESIFDSGGVYPTDDAKKEELEAFVNSLSREHMKKIEEYIGSTPKVEAVVKFVCSCGHENEVKLSGIRSFFD